jgi:hypothetical protein
VTYYPKQAGRTKREMALTFVAIASILNTIRVPAIGVH